MTKNVFGIDLGTTNSAIAWVRDGNAEVIEYEGEKIMPSVVGLDEQGRLLVGTKARNQLAAFPERTAASIKRKMGSGEKVRLGENDHAPEEISAMILKELARRARAVTGERVEHVVITVPAFFRDAQRQATIAAGRIAGLDVLRVINEPTAAALAFDPAGDGERCLLVYDLGGGTFDVSVVRAQEGLLEVLASHGDVHLGGDDFDRLIADDLARRLREAGHDDPRSDRVLDARLLRASEQAKIRLTEETETAVREEFFGTRGGQPAHLDLRLDRQRFEELITPLLEKSLDSVHRALSLAGRRLAEVDDVLLVGGSTRSPIVGRRLTEILGRSPRHDVHPDLCVALGAAVLGARAAGQDSARVLVDVTPYSFGPSHLGEVDGQLSPDCCTPLIERGTPLPVTRSESYFTLVDCQKAWDVRIFQGESRDARENILVGRFTASGLAAVPQGNEILCKMTLDLDGVLHVEAIEKRTGLAKKVTIEGAAAAWTEELLDEARRRTAELWGEEDEPDLEDREPAVLLPRPDSAPWAERARQLIERGRRVRDQMAPQDRAELDELAAGVEEALRSRDEAGAAPLVEELDELVHYVEEA